MFLLDLAHCIDPSVGACRSVYLPISCGLQRPDKPDLPLEASALLFKIHRRNAKSMPVCKNKTKKFIIRHAGAIELRTSTRASLFLVSSRCGTSQTLNRADDNVVTIAGALFLCSDLIPLLFLSAWIPQHHHSSAGTKDPESHGHIPPC